MKFPLCSLVFSILAFTADLRALPVDRPDRVSTGGAGDFFPFAPVDDRMPVFSAEGLPLSGTGMPALRVLAADRVSAEDTEDIFPGVPDGMPSFPEVRVPHSRDAVKLSFSPVVDRAAPAVVNIFTRRVVRQRRVESPFAGDPFFERFFSERFGFGIPRERVQKSLGSGIIVRPDGIIVTNNHVIKDMTEITVVLSDRREYAAEPVFSDPQTDLAVLRIDAGDQLPYLRFADSDSVEVGDLVLAIGNPFGVGQTVTGGIVSALARTGVSLSDYDFFIQTDAAINPGNSGGALVDTRGFLVGVNTAIYSRSGGSDGIGFAIPSRLVQQVIRTAVDGGTLVRPWSGASAGTVTSGMADALGLDRPAGVIINDIWKGGPAARAGLKPGDVITAIDTEPVYDAGTLRYRIGVQEAGDVLEIVYVRDGIPARTRMKLELPPEIPARDPVKLSGNHPLNGVMVDNLSPAYNLELGIDPLSTGVIVVDVESGTYAGRHGLRKGHKIISLDGKAVANSRELSLFLERPANRWELEIDTGSGITPWSVRR